MDDFYKRIKNSVDGNPEAKPAQSDWSSFQSYRAGKDTAPAKPFPWLLASTVGLIALLLSSNIYWATRTMDQSPNVSVSTIHDTIYITKLVDNTASDISNAVAGLESQLLENERRLTKQSNKYNYLQTQFKSEIGTMRNLRSMLDQQTAQVLVSAATDKGNLESTLPIASSQAALNTEVSSATRSFMSQFNVPTLSYDQLVYTRTPLVHPSNIIWVKNKKPFNLMDAIKPKSLSINLNAGYQQGLEERYGNSSGSIFGLRVSTIFSRRVRGYVGVSLYNGKSELEDDLRYPNVPDLTVPEGDEVKEIKIATSTVGLSIGLEYMFYTNSRLRPHIGLGYAHSIFNKDHFTFELESPMGEYKISPEHGINQAPLSQMVFSLGADYNLSSNIDVRSALSYYQGITSNTPSFINLTGGLYYHF